MVYSDISGVFQPELPHAPTSLVVNSIHATEARLQFIPGFNGNTFISLWLVEAQTDYDDDSWLSVYNVSDHDAVSVTVPNLQPHTAYRLRLVAVNVVGQSLPSEPSDWFNTLQARPSAPPTELLVRALNQTALHVRWAVCQLSCALLLNSWYVDAVGNTVENSSVICLIDIIINK